MYHIISCLVKELHFVSLPKQGVPLADTSISNARERSLVKITGSRVEAHMLSLYQLLYLFCVCKALNTM